MPSGRVPTTVTTFIRCLPGRLPFSSGPFIVRVKAVAGPIQFPARIKDASRDGCGAARR
jgi:hypothetical protein